MRSLEAQPLLPQGFVPVLLVRTGQVGTKAPAPIRLQVQKNNDRGKKVRTPPLCHLDLVCEQVFGLLGPQQDNRRDHSVLN